MFKARNLFKVMAMFLLLAFVFTIVPAFEAGAATTPKYVFYFIGDGLGAAQRQATEYFLQEQTGNASAKLLMDTFPVSGINTTHSSDSLITDSAAAGTALATGHKTNNDVISKLPDATDVKTLVECAEEKGIATGLVSTTRITHATPAVFAAHNMDRDAEDEIVFPTKLTVCRTTVRPAWLS